jgi:UDP-N-acetylglucosamine 2-epimerase
VAKIAVVLGTKAELIKMAPVLNELSRKKIAYSLIFTGQHNITSELREHGLRRPEFSMGSPAQQRGRFSSKASASLWSVRAFFWIRRTLARLKPKLVIVHGDTMTTAAASLAAKSFPRPPALAHVEAGLRSGSLSEPFPEEMSRRVTDSLSDWFFCPTYHAAGNLLAEGKPRGRIAITGNTNIDLISHLRPKKKRGNYVIAKLHRHENLSSRKRLKGFIRVLSQSPIPIRLILTENLVRQLKKFGLALPSKVKTLSFRPQKKFAALLSSARAIITDAGGETEEAAFLGVPAIQFRERTERGESEVSGLSVHTTDPGRVLNCLSEIKRTGRLPGAPKRFDRTAFGEGKAAAQIVEFLRGNIL